MDKVLENYLDQVDRHLRPMQASERADIIQEIRSGMLELAAAGLDAAQICQRLGGPKELAAAYLGTPLPSSRASAGPAWGVSWHSAAWRVWAGCLRSPLPVCWLWG